MQTENLSLPQQQLAQYKALSSVLLFPPPFCGVPISTTELSFVLTLFCCFATLPHPAHVTTGNWDGFKVMPRALTVSLFSNTRTCIFRNKRWHSTAQVYITDTMWCPQSLMVWRTQAFILWRDRHNIEPPDMRGLGDSWSSKSKKILVIELWPSQQCSQQP